MQIARTLSGYTLGAADLLRRAMGKKKAEAMDEQGDDFVEGAERNGVPGQVARHIFDLVRKFAGYGFNKSHSAAYALLAYQTAWLKAHYPAEFMAASLTADMEHTDKVVTLIAEARSMGLELHPPSVNHCGTGFRPVTGNGVYYGLGALKGVGERAVDGIVAERERNGPFADLFDFCRRTADNRLNKRVLEALIRGGALDTIDPCRATLMHNVGAAIELAEKETRDVVSGQNDMFGIGARGSGLQSLERVDEWSDQDRLTAEKEVLGLYLTGHPFEPLRSQLMSLADGDIVSLKPSGDRDVLVVGLVTQVRTMKTRRGTAMAFVTLDDNTARIEVSVFSKLFARRRPVLRSDNVLAVRGVTEVDDYSGGVQMRANEVLELADLRMHWLECVELRVSEQHTMGFLPWLRSHLTDTGGSTRVRIHYERSNGDVGLLKLGENWRLKVDDALYLELIRRLGADRISWYFDRTGLMNWRDSDADDEAHRFRRFG